MLLDMQSTHHSTTFSCNGWMNQVGYTFPPRSPGDDRPLPLGVSMWFTHAHDPRELCREEARGARYDSDLPTCCSQTDMARDLGAAVGVPLVVCACIRCVKTNEYPSPLTLSHCRWSLQRGGRVYGGIGASAWADAWFCTWEPPQPVAL